MLSTVFVMITMSAASAKRVAEVLDEQSDLTNGEDPVMEVRDGSVKFDHVSFAYKRMARRPSRTLTSTSSPARPSASLAAPVRLSPALCSCCRVCTT